MQLHQVCKNERCTIAHSARVALHHIQICVYVGRKVNFIDNQKI